MPTSTTTTATAASNTVMYVTGATTGKYVGSVAATAGAIKIVYSSTGNQVANLKINGAILYLTPYLSSNEDIIWVCGLATAPTATLPTGTTAGTTDVSAQYLPSSCHK
jgi:hypothetical protein